MDANGEALAIADRRVDVQDRTGRGTVDPEHKNKGSYANKVVVPTVTNRDDGLVSSLMDKEAIIMEEDKTLEAHVHEIWEPVSTVQLIDLDCNYFLMRLSELPYRYTNAIFQYIASFIGKIEYEGLLQVYFSCGVYGHVKDACGLGVVEQRRKRLMSVDSFVKQMLNVQFGSPFAILENKGETTVAPTMITDKGGAVWFEGWAIQGQCIW
ncbi:hypothetical protein V6N13_089110 [Hibiscus sabdariffa]